MNSTIDSMSVMGIKNKLGVHQQEVADLRKRYTQLLLKAPFFKKDSDNSAYKKDYLDALTELGAEESKLLCTIAHLQTRINLLTREQKIMNIPDDLRFSDKPMSYAERSQFQELMY